MKLHQINENLHSLDGYSYADTPRMRDLIAYGNKIWNSLPPVSNGYTRLFRGNRPGEEGQNPVYTTSLVGIALPFQRSYGGPLTYVDVPTEDLGNYLNNSGTTDSEFTLPPEIVKTARIVEI